MKKFLFPLAFVFALASCSESARLKQLQEQNDSLVVAATQKQAEFDDLLSTLNEVEDGFQQIKDAENYLVVQAQTNTDINKNTKEKLKDDLKFIQETLNNNKAQIEKLEKNSKFQSAQMKKTIARLNGELESKYALITSLQEDLSKKDAEIADLYQSVSDLAGTVDNLTETTEVQQAQIKKKDDDLNTAYYVFGTSKELKDEHIVDGGGLFKNSKLLPENFHKEYFTKVDIRNLKEIPLYSKKAKMLSNMPAGSYSFEKGKDGNITLRIKDNTKFWSLARFLVIQVD
jgi:Prokaryotic membrane lipoprotein lipid attachment site.